VVAGFGLAIFRGRTPLLPMLGVVAALSAIAYLFTPLTAAGPQGAPTAFEVNLRYASPALALGALLLAVDPALTRMRARNLLLGALAVVLLVSAFPIWESTDDVWERDYALGGLVLALLVVGVPLGLVLLARRGLPTAAIAAAGALALGIAIGVGAVAHDRYQDDRYRAATAPSDFPQGVLAALEWFNREQPTDASFAVVGGRPGFKQYVFYGDDLSNRVQYVADEGAHGTYRPIATCEEWRSALNAGDYDYAVIGPDQRTQSQPPVEAEWTGSDPAARQVEEREMVHVFELSGDLDPAGCATLDQRRKAGGGEGGGEAAPAAAG